MGSVDLGREPPPFAFSIEDIYYVLFRRKWMILGFGLLGLMAAFAAWKLRPPPFVSDAKLLIRYIQEKQVVTAATDEARIRPEGAGAAIMQTELAIITSFDLALTVADAIGPERLVGPNPNPPPGREARDAAASFIQAGLQASVSGRSNVIDVYFRGRDPALVQAVLAQVIDSYLARHVQIHSATGVVNDDLTQQTDQLRARLNQTVEELRVLKARTGVVAVEETMRALHTTISSLETEIRAIRATNAERQAELATLSGRAVQTETDSGAPAEQVIIPEEKRSVYRQVTTQLQTLYERERDLLTRFTPETPMVKNVRTQITENEGIRHRLETEYPQLATLPGPTPVRTGAAQTLPETVNPTVLQAQIKAGETRVRVLTEQLAEVRARLEAVSSAETAITELERRKELEEQLYRRFAANLDQRRIDESLGSHRISNLKVLQAPSPPRQDTGKIMKVLAMLAVAGFGGGLALAFGLELFLDQSVKRPSEVESRLNLPLFMSVPRVKNTRAPALDAAKRPLLGSGRAPDAKSPPGSGAELVPWSASHELKTFIDALRNRIVYNFEMRNITRKPKLVAVTSCGPESGVSTIAAGLAASLSETGDGNVLLVDMNPDRKSTSFFHRGDLKVGLDDVLAEDRRDDALVRENLYMVSQNSAEDRLSWVLPKRFASLVPKLKASDYDYIIFDLPPVSQISATPQIARFMDQVLMVVESEKTGRDAVRRASDALKEAGANVGVVLNKTRSYVPARLSQGTF